MLTLGLSGALWCRGKLRDWCIFRLLVPEHAGHRPTIGAGLKLEVVLLYALMPDDKSQESGGLRYGMWLYVLL